MTLDTMTPQERKRQGYIHELIHTEETYVDDLELVLEVSAGHGRRTPGGTSFSSNRPPSPPTHPPPRLPNRSSTSRCPSPAA